MSIIIHRKPTRPVVPPVTAAPTNDAPVENKAKSQPTKKLPTYRIKFAKQLEIIRVYGIKSQNGKAGHYKDVGEMVGIHANTVSLMVGFLVENGFLDRLGDATIATKPVLDFAQAYNWSPESASRKLAPLVRNSWFGSLLLEKLTFRSMTEEEAIGELGGAISAGTELRASVAMLIEYTVATGLVRRDGNQLWLGDEATSQSPEPPVQRPAERPDQREEHQPPRSAAAVSTGFMNTEGAVQFHVSIKVSMQEMSGWAPDRISAFFAGLAAVLAAKKGTEEIDK